MLDLYYEKVFMLELWFKRHDMNVHFDVIFNCSWCRCGGASVSRFTMADEPQEKLPVINAGIVSILPKFGMSATGTVAYTWEVLFPTAQKLHDAGFFDAAIVTAHTAVEAIVDRAMSQSQNVTQATTSENVPKVAEAATEFLNGYNVTNERIRDLYCALTGHAIHKEGFWSALCESSKRRNKIVHQGRRFQSGESVASLKAVKDCIESVAKHNGLDCNLTKVV